MRTILASLLIWIALGCQSHSTQPPDGGGSQNIDQGIIDRNPAENSNQEEFKKKSLYVPQDEKRLAIARELNKVRCGQDDLYKEHRLHPIDFNQTRLQYSRVIEKHAQRSVDDQRCAFHRCMASKTRPELEAESPRKIKFISEIYAPSRHARRIPGQDNRKAENPSSEDFAKTVMYDFNKSGAHQKAILGMNTFQTWEPRTTHFGIGLREAGDTWEVTIVFGGHADLQSNGGSGSIGCDEDFTQSKVE